MKQYKVEVMVYYSKITLDMDHIATSSSAEIQKKLDDYARRGWRFVTANASNFGFAMYIYLYFEADAGVA